MDDEGQGERWGVTGMAIRIIWERGDRWCGTEGRGAGGPRAEKGGGRRMGRDVGMREV